MKKVPAPTNSWGDPRDRLTIEGMDYWLTADPDHPVLYAQREDRPKAEVARFGPGWHPRDVFTAAVIHRFHLVPPS